AARSDVRREVIAGHVHPASPESRRTHHDLVTLGQEIPLLSGWRDADAPALHDRGIASAYRGAPVPSGHGDSPMTHVSPASDGGTVVGNNGTVSRSGGHGNAPSTWRDEWVQQVRNGFISGPGMTALSS